MHIGIIGGGVMGEVIISSLLAKNVVGPDDISVSDLGRERRAELRKSYGVSATDDNMDILKRADMILICVKPQNCVAALEPLRGSFRNDQVLISIMAGVSMQTISRLTGHSRLVRSMPNIPARIGEGMTVWMASENVSDHEGMIVKMIFQAFGLEQKVADEDMIDAATAVSGSGPAYIFYMAENLMKAAQELGFSADEAHRLTQQTFRGAMNLWHSTGDDPEALRRSVTSKGGTTKAALDRFKLRQTPEIFTDAVRQAYIRAGQLREIADGKPDPAEEPTE